MRGSMARSDANTKENKGKCGAHGAPEDFRGGLLSKYEGKQRELRRAQRTRAPCPLSGCSSHHPCKQADEQGGNNQTNKTNNNKKKNQTTNTDNNKNKSTNKNKNLNNKKNNSKNMNRTRRRALTRNQ